MTQPNLVGPADAFMAYVGCRTTVLRKARGRGIEVFGISAKGDWTHRQHVPAGENPSFLVLDEEGRAVHCVHGDGDSVSSFRMDMAGLLHPVDTRCIEGVNPVHLAISPARRWLVVANYATGNVVTLPMHEGGALGPVRHVLSLPDAPGPHRTQQRGAHPHQVVFDPSGRWLLVPDKGCDAIHTLQLDEANGSLALARTLKVAPLSGPRHLAFRADGRMAWTVFELSSEVLTAHFDAETGELLPVSRTSSIPGTVMEENTGAGIVLSADGRWLHVSNRGHGSVVRFDVCAETAALSHSVWTSTGGKAPRFIGAGPRNTLLVANEDADTVMRIGAGESEAFLVAATGSPVCVAISPHCILRVTP